MPFISKDWRSPGEQWVKIGPGWERAKVISYLNSGFFQNGDNGRDESIQPQYNVTTRTTREIRRQNTLSEALLQLDFYSACHDIRRFNYTCRMIQLLLFNMNYLPGNVQRILIRLVEEMASHARENGWKGDAHIVLQSIRDNMLNTPVWGGQLGSTKLWEEHKSNIQKILNSGLNEEYETSKNLPMEAFPEEILRQVLLKLSSDKDIEALSNSSPLLSQISNESRVWRELCKYHFTSQQIDLIHQHLVKLKERNINKRNNSKHFNSNQLFLNRNEELFRTGSESPPIMRSREGSESSSSECDRSSSSGEEDDHTPESYSNIGIGDDQNNLFPHWKLKFKTLKRRYGLSKEEYAEELNLCKSCGLLFWTATDSAPHHDCGIPILIPVKPGDFIKYFCV